MLHGDGTVEFSEANSVVSEYAVEQFGKSNAQVKFEFLEGVQSGIRITIDYTPADGVFGFGIMFGNADLTAGITDLYAVGFGTVDHHIYGDWNWLGNYVSAAQLGIVASEIATENGVRISLFYPFETLCGENYNLNIDATTREISLQMFEYVTDGSGNLYGCYNCINVSGTPLPFDTGVSNFPVWVIREE